MHIESVAKVGLRLAEYVLREGLPEDTVLNVNVPDIPYEDLQGVEVTRMGRRAYGEEIVRREDPRGTAYYWIGGDGAGHVDAPNTDFEAVYSNRVSITPLHRDLTNYESLEKLKDSALKEL